MGPRVFDCFSGLITLADARDLPEGASPRNWDVDFSVGSVYTRPGLVSAFVYANTWQITGYSLGSGGLATFTYVGTPEPTINEGMNLSGFTGALAVLNGTTVYVESVTLNTFMAQVVNGPILTISGLNASAVSATGLFVGPNQGSTATSTSWASPLNVFSPTAYTSTSGGQNFSPSVAPGIATSTSTTAWSNPSGALSTNPSIYATVGFAGAGASAPLYGSGLGLSVPPNATITGVKVAFAAKVTNTSGNPVLVTQLVLGSTALGTQVNIPLAANGSSLVPYSYGSSAYQWGTTLTPAIVNNPTFGASLQASVGPASDNFEYYLNSLVITVYYTTSSSTDTLNAQGFGFSVALTSGISGFTTTFSAFTSTDTEVQVQMLQNGVPRGLPKTLQLTTTSTVYTLGGSEDDWGYLWAAQDVNSPGFGLQLTAEGVGTTYVGDLDLVTYITPALSNFNWIGSYEQNNAALTTLALDADGIIWKEDAINNPGFLSVALSGIVPGSYAVGATMNDSEFIMFSDLNIGTDRPRQLYNNGIWYPVTQVGPGAPPKFSASTGSVSGVLQLVSYAWTAGTPPANGTALFTYQTAAVAPSVGSIYVVAGTGTTLDGQAVIVTNLTVPSTTSFTAEVTGTYPTGTIGVNGTLTPQFFYTISTITQPLIQTANLGPGYLVGNVLWFWLGAGPGNNGVGNTATVFYAYYKGGPGANSPNGDVTLNTAVANALSGQGPAVFVEITNAANVNGHSFNGTWEVTSVGTAKPPGYSEILWYFTFTYTSSGSYQATNNAQYQQTQATMTVPSPGILGVTIGSQITITNVTGTPQSGYNGTWTITGSANAGSFSINGTSSAGGVATYTYGFNSANLNPPIPGLYVTITQTLNDNGAFNGTFPIATVGPGTFTVDSGLPDTPFQTETGQAIMSGTSFTFDPGAQLQQSQNAIFGNTTYAINGGQVAVIGTSIIPIGAGTRQAVVFFITKTGNWTPASPPLASPFTTTAAANELLVTNIPIGPPDVVARAIAITEAGANGVPGANFYVIPVPVTTTVNGVTTTYSSTIINDNTTTSVALSFTDAVLLNSQEVDIPGFNQFNLIEIGSCAWCVPYSSRMFYGLQLNKVQNFNNMSFDGGYLNANNPQPLGWGLYPTATEIQLIVSPVTGDAYYVSNTTGSVQSVMGMIAQTAYQDPYNVAIINSNTEYSVRVSCSCPSGVRIGTLVIDLTDLITGSGFTHGANGLGTYGSFTVPFSEMSTQVTTFSGLLLQSSVFPGQVSPNLQLRVWEQGMGVGADVLIDRIEVYPTLFPYLKTQVYGSYINKPEAVDASGDGGIIDTSTENPQAVMGAFVLRDSLYLMKTSSLYVTKDNPNSEPSGWSLNQIDNRAGACGINAFDTGEEWAIMACRNGIYGFDGGKPELLNLETLQVWNAINFNAGNSICLRNDTENRRILCAVPLPTGISPEGVPTGTTKWLPFAPYNPTPTTPNVILMLNYEAIGSFEELLKDIGVHATLFGDIKNPDMRRKWSIWQIPTPYLGTVTRANLLDMPIFVCNGIGSSKIYQFEDDATSDDGAAIYSSYCTYSFVNAAKAVTMPIFGMHAKRYTILQFNAQGAGQMDITLYPNDLNCRYPLSVPLGLPYGIKLNYPTNDDLYRNINVKGQRVFVEYSTDAVGAWFELCKMLMTGKADPWSALDPTGGGNLGITS